MVPTAVERQYKTIPYYNKRADSNYNCSNYLKPRVEGCKIVARCDNEGVVTVLGSRYSKEPHIMHMLHMFFFIEATV